MIKNEKKKKENSIWLWTSWHRNIHRIINITLITVAVFLLGVYITQWEHSEEETQTNRALEIMIQIDDLAHVQFADMEIRGNPSWYTWYVIYHEIDNGFHNSTNIQERFERAKKMDAFFDGMDTELHRIWWLTSNEDKERDRKYHLLDNTFDQLQLKE